VKAKKRGRLYLFLFPVSQDERRGEEIQRLHFPSPVTHIQHRCVQHTLQNLTVHFSELAFFYFCFK
jgi:hypothetical protein